MVKDRKYSIVTFLCAITAAFFPMLGSTSTFIERIWQRIWPGTCCVAWYWYVVCAFVFSFFTAFLTTIVVDRFSKARGKVFEWFVQSPFWPKDDVVDYAERELSLAGLSLADSLCNKIPCKLFNHGVINAGDISLFHEFENFERDAKEHKKKSYNKTFMQYVKGLGHTPMRRAYIKMTAPRAIFYNTLQIFFEKPKDLKWIIAIWKVENENVLSQLTKVLMLFKNPSSTEETLNEIAGMFALDVACLRVYYHWLKYAYEGFDNDHLILFYVISDNDYNKELSGYINKCTDLLQAFKSNSIMIDRVYISSDKKMKDVITSYTRVNKNLNLLEDSFDELRYIKQGPNLKTIATIPAGSSSNTISYFDPCDIFYCNEKFERKRKRFCGFNRRIKTANDFLKDELELEFNTDGTIDANEICTVNLK